MKTAFSGKFHSGERFRKAPFSLIVFVGYVWMEVVSIKKNSRFQMKTDTCGQGLISKTTMHVHQTFLYISLTSLQECDVKFFQVTFYDVDVTFFITPIIRYPPKRLHFSMYLKFVCQNVTRVSTRSSEKQLQVSLK